MACQILCGLGWNQPCNLFSLFLLYFNTDQQSLYLTSCWPSLSQNALAFLLHFPHWKYYPRSTHLSRLVYSFSLTSVMSRDPYRRGECHLSKYNDTDGVSRILGTLLENHTYPGFLRCFALVNISSLPASWNTIDNSRKNIHSGSPRACQQ